MVYHSSSPNIPLMHHTWNSLVWSLAKERLGWIPSNSLPSKSGNHLPQLKAFVSSYILQISPMLSLHSTSLLKKTNPGPGLPFNNKHLKLLRRPFPLDLFSSSLMSHNLSLSWLMPPCLLLVQFFSNWHQWRPPPLCLFLLHLSSCGMELQHLHMIRNS